MVEDNKKSSQVAGTTSEDKKISEITKKIFDGQITLNQARESLGLEKIEDIEMNQLLVKCNVISS